MKILVTFQSRSGNTERAAEYIGGEFENRGHNVTVRPYDGLDFSEVSKADVVCVGTWVHGLFVIGQHPGDTERLEKMPKLWNKPTACFMTYAFNAGSALDGFAEFLENELGAHVICGQAMKAKHAQALAAGFVEDVLSRIKTKVA